MISYEPLRETLKSMGISIYALEKAGIFGKATTPVLKSDSGNVNTKTLNAICQYLNVPLDRVAKYISEDKDAE